MWIIAEKEAYWIEESVVKKLNGTVQSNGSRGWRIVSSFADIVQKHGWCAVDGVQRGISVRDAALLQQRQLTYPLNSDGRFDAYAHRARWFRTMNDSILVEQHSADPATQDKGDLLDSTMHPTAELHAAIADSVLQAMQSHGDETAGR